jgi:hypothetical protein
VCILKGFIILLVFSLCIKKLSNFIVVFLCFLFFFCDFLFLVFKM